MKKLISSSLVLLLFALVLMFVGGVLLSQNQFARAQFAAQGLLISSANVGGTANAVTLNIPNALSLSDLLGIPVRFIPKSNNTAGGTTITVNSFSTLNVMRWSLGALVPVADHDLSTASFAEVVYDGTQEILKNPGTGSDPVGKEVVFTFPASGSISSIPGYLIENGQCVSEATYSALWAAFGSSDIWANGSTGGACSSGNFHVKFANGRGSVAANNQGGQTGPLTLCTAGVGNTCGAQSLAQSALPNVTIPVADNMAFNASQLGVTVGSTNVVAGEIGNISTASINGGVTQTTSMPPVNQNIFAVKY